jgi:hypothetical protein
VERLLHGHAHSLQDIYKGIEICWWCWLIEKTLKEDLVRKKKNGDSWCSEDRSMVEPTRFIIKSPVTNNVRGHSGHVFWDLAWPRFLCSTDFGHLLGNYKARGMFFSNKNLNHIFRFLNKMIFFWLQISDFKQRILELSWSANLSSFVSIVDTLWIGHSN